MLIFTLVLLLCSVVQNDAESFRCYADTAGSPSPNDTYSWYTPYPASRRPGEKIGLPTDNQNLTLIYVWGLTRHGLRHTCIKDNHMMRYFHEVRDKIVSNHKKGQGKLCKKDLENLRKWKTNETKALVYKLTKQGIADVIYFAKSVKKNFPIFSLSESSPMNDFEFMSSDSNRSIHTAILFSNTVMEKNYSNKVGNNIMVDDIFLHLENNCEVYSEKIKDKELEKPINLFFKSKYWKKMAEEITDRLGFREPISKSDIVSMYKICAFELAWNPKSKPPVCAVFLKEDLEVLEYIFDMNFYYKRGYANSMVKKVGCPMVRDMMLSLSNAAANISKTKGRFLFGHSETILPTTIKLGLSKDEKPLTTEDYPKLVQNRKWKIAYFDGFTANIIAALYTRPSREGPEPVVIFYQNEHPVELPSCGIPCPLIKLKKIFEDVFDENKCSDEFCWT